MNALLVIDMQVGMLEGNATPYNLDHVVQRINDVAQAMRNCSRPVILVQHHGAIGDPFAEGEPGWRFLPSLRQAQTDLIIAKTICDAFYNTRLDSLLKQHQVDELLISGWATDFCVDTTIRAAASRDYNITVISDAHTAADRPHLNAAAIIQHHNLTWSSLILPQGRKIRTLSAAAMVRGLRDARTPNRPLPIA